MPEPVTVFTPPKNPPVKRSRLSRCAPPRRCKARAGRQSRIIEPRVRHCSPIGRRIDAGFLHTASDASTIRVFTRFNRIGGRSWRGFAAPY
jgi:hypothetical protein